MVYVPAISLDALTQEAHSYRRLRKHRAALVRFAQQSLHLIDRLEAALQTQSKIGVKRKMTRGKR